MGNFGVTHPGILNRTPENLVLSSGKTCISPTKIAILMSCPKHMHNHAYTGRWMVGSTVNVMVVFSSSKEQYDRQSEDDILYRLISSDILGIPFPALEPVLSRIA